MTKPLACDARREPVMVLAVDICARLIRQCAERWRRRSTSRVGAGEVRARVCCYNAFCPEKSQPDMICQQAKYVAMLYTNPGPSIRCPIDARQSREPSAVCLDEMRPPAASKAEGRFEVFMKLARVQMSPVESAARRRVERQSRGPRSVRNAIVVPCQPRDIRP